ncbi:MAG: Gfo/Idh/MocA family oxidoreductase [Dysgonamonadaceae bacterium]|jgi:predicted dehydrogenase|nr:Gfo/Idh/MocA family oxidoreductase [Dysgonamonadaceae bacterium]
MIRWGIIGCGDVCEIKSGPAFYKCKDSALVAVMRRNAEKAKAFAINHHVPKYYSNVDDLINDRDVDAVYIATPPESHAELTIRALQAGKPVYVEKPMALNYDECLRMIETAETCNQKLFVAYYRRSLAYFLKVKELIDSGIIGKIQVVKGEFFRSPLLSDKNVSTHTWRIKKEIAGGGYFYDMASHTIDILMFLLGKITKANGITGNTGGFYEVEDTVSVSFLFETGIIGSAVWCYASSQIQEKDSIEIIGEKGSVSFASFAFSDIELRLENKKVETFNFPKPQHIQMDMIQSVVDELDGKGVCPSTGETGALTNRVIDLIYQTSLSSF